MTAKTDTISRRKIITTAAALAPAGALAAIPAPDGGGENDRRLRALFVEWEPVHGEYLAASAAEEAADDARAEARYRAPERVHEALKAIRLRQVAEEVLNEMRAKGELDGIQHRTLTPFDERKITVCTLEPFMQEGEEPEGFLQFCRDEYDKEDDSKHGPEAAAAEAARAVLQEVIGREREIGERMAAVRADSMAGVALKLRVAQEGVPCQSLNVSIMEDMRRFMGLPSGVDKFGDDAFLVNVGA